MFEINGMNIARLFDFILGVACILIFVRFIFKIESKNINNIICLLDHMVVVGCILELATNNFGLGNPSYFFAGGIIFFTLVADVLWIIDYIIKKKKKKDDIQV